MVDSPAIADDENKDQLTKYSQKELDKTLRPQMVDLALMSVKDIMALRDDPQRFEQLTGFKATWLQVLLRAITKGEMPAATFVQEHVMGKAIQRIQSETVTYTYQDLLHKIKKAEDKYQVIAAEIVEPAKKTWGDLL